MTQTERRLFLIQSLLDEQEQYRNMEIPTDKTGQKRLLRALFNIRMPKPVSREFLEIQDEYLKMELSEKGITRMCEKPTNLFVGWIAQKYKNRV